MKLARIPFALLSKEGELFVAAGFSRNPISPKSNPGFKGLLGTTFMKKWTWEGSRLLKTEEFGEQEEEESTGWRRRLVEKVMS